MPATTAIAVAQRPAFDRCEQEPIHRLGRTQRFGVLLGLDARQRIVLASANAADWGGQAPQALLGQPAAALLPRRNLAAAMAHAAVAQALQRPQHLFSVAWPGRREAVDVAIHVRGGLTVIEAEPAGADLPRLTEVLQACTRAAADCDDVPSLARSAVQAVASLTSYDRVMAYRFACDHSGEVIAEHRAPGMAPYLGLRYPAGDIPAQARALYLLNPTRVVADARDEGLPLLAVDPQPPDLSLATLRSVSPMHLQYLRNMKTAASMSISLVVDGRLWGLIACHHRRPHRPPLAARTLAEAVGQLYSLAISRLERLAVERAVRSLLLRAPGVEPLVDPAADAAMRDTALEDLKKLFGAQGGVLHIDGRTISRGQVPPPARTQALVDGWAAEGGNALQAVASLAAHDAGFAALAPQVAGVLAMPLSSGWRDWLLLFRDEALQHVTWAGRPSAAPADGRHALHPRASFEAWRQAVRLHCEPWSPADLQVAEATRVRLLEVLLAFREQRELAQVRNAAQHQALLVRELNHRVRNMLGLIQGLVQQSASRSVSVEDMRQRLHDRVLALARAYTQVEQAHWRPAPLAPMMAAELGAFSEPGQVALAGDAVRLDPDAFLSMAMVVHELATNARKYGALSTPAGRLQVRWALAADGSLALDWRESGGPPVQPPRHAGFGTQVIRKALEHAQHGRSELHFEPGGLRASLLLPQGAAWDPDGLEPAAATAAPALPAAALPQRALVVEDDLVIALLAETMLRQAGCADVLIAGSASEALALIGRERFDLALLDVNLGSETSEPVAHRLAELGVPALVATGYGQADALPPALRELPRIGKPYVEQELRLAIAAARAR